MGREITKVALNFIVFFLILFIYTKLAGPLPFSVNSVTTTKTSTFDVTAEGKVSVKPDTATIQAGVSAEGTTAQEVQDKIDNGVSKVSNAVKKLGIESKDIKTSNYNINPQYDINQRIKNYQGNTSLSIKIEDASLVDRVIKETVSAGATNVNSSGFEVGDREKYENEARKEAVEKAKKKAEEAAKIAGFKLGKIVNYQESFGNFPRPIPLSAESKAVDTIIEPGEEEITITVTLSFALE